MLAAALLIILCTAAVILLLPSKMELSTPSEMLSRASAGLDCIAIDTIFSPSDKTLEVTQTLTMENRSGQELASIVLRTLPNAFQSTETSPCASTELIDSCYPNGFSTGALVMHSAEVTRQGNSSNVSYRYADDAKTVLTLPLSKAWQAGETLDISLKYTVQIPHAAYRFGEYNGFWALGNCFAVPAMIENGEARTDEYLAVGDPPASDVMNYKVSIAMPNGYQSAASGYPQIVQEQDQVIYHYDSPAIREFALVISDAYEMVADEESNIVVTAYAFSKAKANEMLEYAKKALKCYGDLYGDYPYQSFTLCEIDFPMGGMEYPQMVMISSSQIELGGYTLEQVIAHEVAHQWWYAVVGSDSFYQAWQDEALSEFSVLAYTETYHGMSAREQKQEAMDYAMRITIPRGITPGAPLSYFESMSEYALVVYNRGGAMLVALNQAMNGNFNSFLKVYYERYAFTRATRADFEALLAEYSGEDYAPLIIDYLDTYIVT